MEEMKNLYPLRELTPILGRGKAQDGIHGEEDAIEIFQKEEELNCIC